MHPALITALAAQQRRDQIAQATAARRARQARRARRAAGTGLAGPVVTGPAGPVTGSQPSALLHAAFGQLPKSA